MTGTPRELPAVTAVVAATVRALRTGRKWSLDELAGRSGVSKGMLVQIEAGRTNPSIGTLVRVADAFGVTVAQLIEPPATPGFRVIAADEPVVLWRGPAGGTCRLLCGLTDPYVELWEWVLEPGEVHRSDDHASGTREMMHVLAGAVTVSAEGTERRVAAGETAVFRGDRPHGYRNDGAVTARATMAVTMPGREFDRRSG